MAEMVSMEKLVDVRLDSACDGAEGGEGICTV